MNEDKIYEAIMATKKSDSEFWGAAQREQSKTNVALTEHTVLLNGISEHLERLNGTTKDNKSDIRVLQGWKNYVTGAVTVLSVIVVGAGSLLGWIFLRETDGIKEDINKIEENMSIYNQQINTFISDNYK